MSTISHALSFVRIPALALSLIAHFAGPSYAAEDRRDGYGTFQEALQARRARAAAAQAAKQATPVPAVKGTGTAVPGATSER